VQTALDELRQANDLVQRHSEQLERATAMHERLHGVMLTGGGLLEVATRPGSCWAATSPCSTRRASPSSSPATPPAPPPRRRR
jgi:hypothetical protein